MPSLINWCWCINLAQDIVCRIFMDISLWPLEWTFSCRFHAANFDITIISDLNIKYLIYTFFLSSCIFQNSQCNFKKHSYILNYPWILLFIIQNDNPVIDLPISYKILSNCSLSLLSLSLNSSSISSSFHLQSWY